MVKLQPALPASHVDGSSSPSAAFPMQLPAALRSVAEDGVSVWAPAALLDIWMKLLASAWASPGHWGVN